MIQGPKRNTKIPFTLLNPVERAGIWGWFPWTHIEPQKKARCKTFPNLWPPWCHAWPENMPQLPLRMNSSVAKSAPPQKVYHFWRFSGKSTSWQRVRVLTAKQNAPKNAQREGAHPRGFPLPPMMFTELCSSTETVDVVKSLKRKRTNL